MNKKELITRNLQEVIGEEELDRLLKSKKNISIYWGTMPTGSISLAYFFPMLKIADFLKAGVSVKIFLADLHAGLDGVSWEILEKRYKYYEKAIKLILKEIGVQTTKLEFIRGSDLQLNKKYFEDLLKLCTLTSVRNAIKSASEAVKTAQGENVKLSGMVYPLMQALDEEYLGVDAQFAGLDQRKIMVYAREYLPKIGYKPKIELMTPMIRGLSGEKMSSSIGSSKIDLLEDEKTIKNKINNAEMVAGNSKNGIMDLLKYLIFIFKENKNQKFIIKRQDKYGGNLVYSDYASLEKDFVAKKIHPLDLKNAVAEELIQLLRIFREDKALNELYKKAYD